jgi:capsular polysaccharide transport system permease protein
MAKELRHLKRILRHGPIYVHILRYNMQPYFALMQQGYVKPIVFAIKDFLLKYRIFTGVVIIPWLIVAFYLLVICEPEYESSAKIVIEKAQEQNPINISAGLFGGGTSNNETYLTQEYITSREMMNRLQMHFDFKQHFQTPKIDLLSRLKKNPSLQDYQDYFQKKVNATVDMKTNEINITARAFKAPIAKLLVEKVIEESKLFVNRVYNAVSDEQYNFAKAHLETAKDRLTKVSKEVLEWQNRNGMFDPAESAKVVGNVTAGLKTKLVEKQTELTTYSAYMQPGSSKVVGLKEEISALKKQIEEQTSDLLSRKKETDNLNRVMINYQWLQLQLKFAQTEYESAQQNFEQASLNIIKQKNSIVEIDTPNLPDEYEYPQRFYDLVNFLILFLVIFFLIKMALNIVHEHTD